MKKRIFILTTILMMLSVTDINAKTVSQQFIDNAYMYSNTDFPVAGISKTLIDLHNKPQIQIKEKDIIKQQQYTDEKLSLLAHVIFAEAGADYIDDTTLYYVGSVVLNRVNSSKYPDTIRDVVYQKNQYECVTNGAINKTPTDRCYKIAKDLLENGSILPDEVFGQADETVYKKYGKKLYDKRCGECFFYVK